MHYVVVVNGVARDVTWDISGRDHRGRRINPCISARMSAKMTGGVVWIVNDVLATRLPV